MHSVVPTDRKLMQFSFALLCCGVGQVTIDLFIEKETNFIVLHIQDLNVTEKVSLAVVWYRNCHLVPVAVVLDCVFLCNQLSLVAASFESLKAVKVA